MHMRTLFAALAAFAFASAAHAQDATPAPLPDLAALHADVRAAAEQARAAETEAREAAERARNAARNGERTRGGSVTDGNGYYEFRNGAIYAGSLVNGAFDGFGVYQFSAGETPKYEGAFSAGALQGVGVYTWANGAAYLGQWTDGVSQGAGVFTLPDGRRFEGLWQGDKRNGPGVEWSADGSVRAAGLWRDNQFVGPISP